MKTFACLAVALFITLISHAQTKFQKGYFIDETGNTTTCFIKNQDWKNTPTHFEYQLTEGGNVLTAGIGTIKEFAITDHSKFVRFTVNMDTSEQSISKLDYQPAPEYKEVAVFLEAILEGKSTLYTYKSGNSRKYFIAVDHVSPVELINKKYLFGDKQIATNAEYKQQLSKLLNINDPGISYRQADLVKAVNRFNIDNGAKSEKYNKQTRKFFHMSVGAAAGYNSLSFSNSQDQRLNGKFDSKINIAPSVEMEFILPYNNGKWAIPIEFYYQYYKGKTTAEPGGITVKYQSVEAPLGVRYYLFLNDDSKISVTGSFILQTSFGSKLEIARNHQEIELEGKRNFRFGIGYSYKKLQAAVRYDTQRDLTKNYLYWKTGFNNISVRLAYGIF